MTTRNYWISLSIVASALLINGCSTPREPPREKLASAESAISRAAKDSKVLESAPLELRLAEEKLQKAKEAVQKQDYDAASQLADQALADVKLAEEKARTERAKEVTKDTRENLDTFKKEVNRTAPK